MNFLKKKWPFAANAISLVFMVMLGLYLFDDVLGFSGVFQAVFGYAEEAIAEESVPQIEWDWQIGMLLGIFIGSLCGSLIHGSWKFMLAFEDHKGFTGKVLHTPIWGFVAGFLVMLGAILGGEVFYGHFASAMEMAAGSWFFIVLTLISGGVTALFIERRRDGGAE